MENLFKFNQSEKVKIFVERIVAECEQEGLTVAEALAVPQALDRELLSHVSAMKKQTRFTRSTLQG
jgi:hypothetical protein